MTPQTAEQYIFGKTKERSWFIVTLCEHSGTVDIQSDYGNWQHCWGKLGRGGQTLKQFLGAPRDHFSYFEDKFGYSSPGREGANHWFDCEATTKKILEDIEKHFGTIPEGWDADIGDLECIDCKTGNEYYHQIPDRIITEIYDGDPFKIPMVNTTHPSLVMFMEKCWPVFIDYLRKEMEGNNVQSES